MFTPGGQIDRLTFAGLRGGGKGGGGGGYAADPPKPVYTDPVTGMVFSEQDQLNQEIAQRKVDEKAASDAAVVKKQQDDAAALTKFQGNRDTAYNDARTNVLRQFQQQGVDPNPYLETDINPALQRQLHSIKDLDPNPSAAFDPTLGSTIMNQLTSGKRTGATNTLNSLFSPTYSSTAIPDDLTGKYADTLINEQFDPLNTQLGYAQKRGTLTQTGYDAALNALAGKRETARATIGDLGSGIISRDRGALDDYLGKARSDANALTLGTNFDPTVYQTGASNLASKDIADFGGALRNAVGGTSFATLGELINAGGAVQGATNPNAANPIGLGGMASSLTDDQTKKRGLGSTGAF